MKNHPLQDDIARKIISDKCNLLISKFKTKYDNDEFFRSLSISHEFIDSDINPTQVSIEYLKEFYNYIINLYPKNREDNFSYLEEYYHKKNGVATQFKDFFIFAQYYRKVSKRTSDINELITNYKNKFEPLLGKNKFFDVRCINNDDYMVFDFSDIGKTIFYTREEAERALKEE